MDGKYEEFFTCDCGIAHHFVKMTYWIDEDDSGYIDETVYIDIVSGGCGFWKRLKEALGYVFFNTELVHSDVVWSKETSDRFIEAIKKVPWSPEKEVKLVQKEKD